VHHIDPRIGREVYVAPPPEYAPDETEPAAPDRVPISLPEEPREPIKPLYPEQVPEHVH
jgi:hypothetical protein